MSLGLIITGCRRRARTCLVAGGTIKLRLAGRSIILHGVFTILSLLLFALVTRVVLLRRILSICWVQPKPLLRLSNSVIIHLRGKGTGVGVVGDRGGTLDDSRPHRLQLLVGLLPLGGQLGQIQPRIPSSDELQRPPGA